MAKGLKNLTSSEAKALRAEALRELIDLLAVIEREAEKTATSNRNVSYVKLPLVDAILKFLATCEKPQTIKQIAMVLEAAGQDFGSAKPIHVVRYELKKLLVVNDDIFHLGWQRWHLKSKYSKRKLKQLQDESRFGLGGRSADEHAALTKSGLEAARARGQHLGAKRKLTPEIISQIRKMLGQPHMKVGDVAKHFGIAESSIWANGIRRKDCRNIAALQVEKHQASHIRLVASNE